MDDENPSVNSQTLLYIDTNIIHQIFFVIIEKSVGIDTSLVN